MSNDARAAQRQKYAWLEAVARHPGLSATAKSVAMMIMVRYADRQGKAWPSQKRLGDDIGRSERQVRTAIGELVDEKFLHSNVRKGPRGDQPSALYSIRIPEAHFRNNTGSALPLFDNNTGSPAHENRKHPSDTTGSALPPNPIREPFSEPSVCVQPPLSELIELWGGDPSPEVAAAFDAALKLSPADVILDGARRWVVLPRPAYPRDLTTWLRERRWKDEPTNGRGVQHERPNRAPRRDRLGEALERVRAEMQAQNGGEDGDA